MEKEQSVWRFSDYDCRSSSIVMAVILKNSFGAAMAAVGAVILAAVVTLVYAHKVYVQEIESKKGGKD